MQPNRQAPAATAIGHPDTIAAHDQGLTPIAVTLLLLGRLADLAPAPELALPAPLDWATLLAALPAPLAEAARGDRVRCALNGALLPDKTVLSAGAGDEVALLPPVSGGGSR